MKRQGSVVKTIALFLLAVGAGQATAQEMVLYSFANAYPSADGFGPEAGLIRDARGNLYGTTWGGGASDDGDVGGTVFELTPAAGGGWTEKVLYSFRSHPNDGDEPVAGLILDAKGDLFGTTHAGGTDGGGTAFELTPAAGGTWTEKVLHSFGAGDKDGTDPVAGLISDANGNLYGTARDGGANGAGAVYELTPAANGTWSEKVLYSFQYFGSDGNFPDAGLIFDAKGNLYGTTVSGGENGEGTVFELLPEAGKDWTEEVLYSFKNNDADGDLPEAGLIFDAKGNLYGTTSNGGAHFYYGTVFELSPTAGGGWAEKVLYSFQGYPNGGDPFAGLIDDAAGNLYGTTYGGGAHNGGTVFQLASAANGDWTEKVLHSFGAASNDGADPQSNLVLDGAGNLYGTTVEGGGAYTHGTVFEIESVTKVHLPEFSPGGGPYLDAQTVKITDSTPDSTIYYTTNGDTPSTSSEKYTDSIDVSESETVKAIAEAKGLTNSAVSTATYEIDESAAKPVFSEPGTTYKSAQSVTITDETPDSIIYYTTNGKTPTTSSTRYTKAVDVSESETVKAIAVAKGYKASQVASAAYVIK